MTGFVDPINFFALRLLDHFGNDKPTQNQIDLMEFLLLHSYAFKKVENNFILMCTEFEKKLQ